MHPASANSTEGPSDAHGGRVCLPPSAGELMSMVVSAVASPRTRSTSGDVRSVTLARRPARLQRYGMLVLALVSPFAALGFLFVMQGFERWVLGPPPDVVPPYAILVAGIAQDDLDRTRSIPYGGGIAQPRLSAVAAQADLFGRRAQKDAAATYGNHRRDAA
jgi:hypothetical protein